MPNFIQCWNPQDSDRLASTVLTKPPPQSTYLIHCFHHVVLVVQLLRQLSILSQGRET